MPRPKNKSSLSVAEDRIQAAIQDRSRSLDLSGLGLSELLPSFSRLTGLKRLDLANNQLTALPESIAQLDRLQTLSLNENRLTALPESIGRLASLQTLFLSRNQLTTLPESIGQLAGLQTLTLDGNKLTSLPEWIGLLTALQTFSVSDNELTALPKSIGQLSDLKTLYLDGNQLTALPKDLLRLSALRHVYLHGNTALRLPREVLGPTWQHGLDEEAPPAEARAILDYYFRTRQAKRPLNEVKLLLVGRGGAGKTSIMRRLRENKFNSRQRETPGITIKPWPLKCGKHDVRVHIWDFAGQIITHATHQFFLTHRSVYVLVLTGREDTEMADAEYWLRLIRAFGTDHAAAAGSRVIVALNKFKSHVCRVDRNALREKYPFIVDFVETDCKTGTGIARLKTVLRQTVGSMQSVRQPFPVAWWDIKDRLGRMQQDYLSYGEYRTLCAQYGEGEETSQDNLAIVLHALGVALNYADDARLREATILNPHWVTNGIYTLLRQAVRDDGSGEMRMTDVRKVLPREKPEMRTYLVELMRRFELAFPLTEDGQRWLVPQRLAPEQPKLGREWQQPGGTRLRYRYTALPEGLLPRFITRTYPLGGEKPTRWMNGVVLELDEARSLVRADPAEREVTVIVRGQADDRRRLAGLIRSDLKRIHDDIRGLDPAEEIELEDQPGVFVSLRTLQADEQNAQPSAAATEAGTIPVDHTQQLNRVSAPAARDPAQWKPRLFISYSSRDPQQFAELDTRLKPLRSEGLIESWSDRCLVAGEPWDKVIRRELEEADIVVFLVSPHFEATDYIRDVEMKRALERADAGEAIVVSIVLEECGWKRLPLAQYQVLPPKGAPVRDTRPQRKAWHAVAEGLRKVIDALQNQRHATLNSGHATGGVPPIAAKQPHRRARAR